MQRVRKNTKPASLAYHKEDIYSKPMHRYPERNHVPFSAALSFSAAFLART